MTPSRIIIACGLILAVASTARAERYAVLVGVSTYLADPKVPNLEGPAEDVPALARLLVDRFGFAPRNVVTLVNQAATKQGILAALAAATARVREGDYLLFYFSGHGTSAFDPKTQAIVSPFIGPNSGAIVPHDFRIDTAANIEASLIIGKNDIRPLLERVHAGATVAVILDSCYSENAARTIPARIRGRTRGVTLGSLLPTGSRVTAAQTTAAAPPAVAAASSDEQIYPYQNVITLTAASKDEQALDIDSRMLVGGRYATVDGRAHGAFTNSLLQALSGEGDGNRDGTITFQELYDFTRQTMQARYPHTPQLLAPVRPTALSAPALGLPGTRTSDVCTPQATPAPADVRVALEEVGDDARRALAAAAGVRVVDETPDLILRGGGGSFDLHEAGGAVIRQFGPRDIAAVVDRVRAHGGVMRLTGYRPSCPSFGASMRLLPTGRIRFSGRDRIEIQAELERPAYLLALNIDTAGAVSVIYPGTQTEGGRQAAGTPLRLGTVQPVAPYGSEWLKLLAFTERPPVERLGCRTSATGVLDCPVLEPGSPGFTALMQLVEGETAPAAESRLRFVTLAE